MWTGGGNLTERLCAFSNDGSRLLCCSGSHVKVFSTTTGEQVASLSGHSDSVTCVASIGSSTAWTSSLDGTLKLWDFTSSTLLRTCPVGHPIESLVVPGPSLVAYLSVWVVHAGAVEGQVILFDLSVGKIIPGFVLKTSKPRQLVGSPRGGFVGVIDSKTIRIIATASQPHPTTSSLSHSHPLRALAFNWAETQVAAGDDRGQISVWHNAIGKGSGTVTAQAVTKLHWHAHAVGGITFSSDGAYLYSVGREAVLVLWQLESGARNFLPRLGGPLTGIRASPDPSVLAVQSSDNAIRLLNVASMAVERSIEGMRPRADLSAPAVRARLEGVLPVPAVLDPKEGCLVVPTRTAGLHFFSLPLNRHVAHLMVGPRNVVPRDSAHSGDDVLAASVWVTHVAFSPDGSSLGTVEVRSPEGGVGESTCLKLWERVSGSPPRFRVNTLVEEPLQGLISALTFSPGGELAVTCGVGGEFKVWVRVVGPATAFCWRCRSVGGYAGKPLWAASFSGDGSLLAVSGGAVITLWNPTTNSLLCALTAGPLGNALTRLHFVDGTPYLVAAYERRPQTPVGERSRVGFAVWNLVTASLWWSYAMSVASLAVDPNAARFAVLLRVPAQPGRGKKGGGGGGKGFIVVFEVESPTPVAAWDVQHTQGLTLLFSPGGGGRGGKVGSSLVVLSGGAEYAVVEVEGDGADGAEEEGQMSFGEESQPSERIGAYEAMYGKMDLSKAPVVNGEDAEEGVVNARPWGQLFSGPSHVLPALTRIAPAFMEAMLKKIEVPQ